MVFIPIKEKAFAFVVLFLTIKPKQILDFVVFWGLIKSCGKYLTNAAYVNLIRRSCKPFLKGSTLKGFHFILL